MTRCPCHPLGIHYFVFHALTARSGVTTCIDCGEHRRDALKGAGGSEIVCGPICKKEAA